MGGINGTEFVIIALLIIIVVGPEKLPELAAQLGRLVREAKKIASGAKARVEEEFGPDIDELKALDPRQYDPRRIVREALADDPTPPRRTAKPTVKTPQRPASVPAKAATSASAVSVAVTNPKTIVTKTNGEGSTSTNARSLQGPSVAEDLPQPRPQPAPQPQTASEPGQEGREIGTVITPFDDEAT